MSELLPPRTDEDGTTWYPVQHALGGIGLSLTPESQKLWQDYADKQSKWLKDRAKNTIFQKLNFGQLD